MLEGLHLLLIIMSVIIMFTSALTFGLSVDDTYTEEEVVDAMFKTMVVSFMVFIVLLPLYIFGSNKVEKQPWTYHEPYATERIVSLNDNNMMNGRMYLRRGYIESDLYYQYIVDIGNGGYKTNKVRSNNATLYYSDGNYRVEWYEKTKQWLWFKTEGKYHKIYIPEGSITDDYTVDLM